MTSDVNNFVEHIRAWFGCLGARWPEDTGLPYGGRFWEQCCLCSWPQLSCLLVVEMVLTSRCSLYPRQWGFW